jgi:DnaJ family protein C protein 11
MILTDSASRKMKAEEAKQGLVIIEARYGAKDGDDMIDVTVAIQALVNDSKLTIPGGHAKVSVKPQVKLSDNPYTFNCTCG